MWCGGWLRRSFEDIVRVVSRQLCPLRAESIQRLSESDLRRHDEARQQCRMRRRGLSLFSTAESVQPLKLCVPTYFDVVPISEDPRQGRDNRRAEARSATRILRPSWP